MLLGAWRAAALALLVLLAAPSGQVGAQDDESFGVTPTQISLDAAQRGETYVTRVRVQNQFDSATVVEVTGGGDIGAWSTTSPPSGFTVPARSEQAVEVRVAVPEDAPNGRHEGQLTFTAEARDGPDGSGLSVRYSVGVLLNATVGGAQHVEVAWLGADAADIEAGDVPRIVAVARNDGNVRATPRVEARIYPLQGDQVLADGSGSAELRPGEEARIPLDFTDTLPEGQYRATLRSVDPPGFERTVDFRAVEPGTLSKAGELRFLRHPPQVDVGAPARIEGAFVNTGEAPILMARLTLEVSRGGTLVEVLQSDPLRVGIGETVNLTVFFTPAAAGRHELQGTVTYDGFQTLPAEGFLEVRRADDGTVAWWPAAAGAVVVAAFVAGLVVTARRRRV